MYKSILLIKTIGLCLAAIPSFSQNPIISDGKVQTSRIDYKNEGVWYMPDYTRNARIKESMAKATFFMRSISTKGGYVGMYSTDLKKRFGEGFYELAIDTEIFTQYPGTPAMGDAFLRAYRVTGDEEYLSAAYDAGLALAWGQRSIGGWDHLVDISHFFSHKKDIERKDGNCSFDDNITQGVLIYLMDLDQFIDEEWLTETIELGLEFMLESQAKNGAWPQWYPSIGSYHDYWTFNDDAIRNCIRVMMRAHDQYNNEVYYKSVEKAGDFILLSQIKGKQAGWAQQYDHDLKPAWARRFEPPGVCSAVTASTIRTLIDIYFHTKNEKYLSPIPAAMKWLDESRLDEFTWARLYELETNKPIYGQHDRKVHMVASEGRSDYRFTGDFGINETIEYCTQILNSKKLPSKEELTEAARRSKIDNMMKSVQRAMALQSDDGYWIDLETGMLNLDDYVTYMNLFCEHLELTKDKH